MDSDGNKMFYDFGNKELGDNVDAPSEGNIQSSLFQCCGNKQCCECPEERCTSKQSLCLLLRLLR